MDSGYRLDRERMFHDAWANSVRPRDVAVRAAFEALTTPENRLILRLMGPLAGQRILDLGSGLGESAVYFALQGASVTATDVSPEMCALSLGTAREYGVTLNAVATPIESLDVAPGTYDIAYGANLLHHVADVDAALTAVRRAPRPGGRCFFFVGVQHAEFWLTTLRLFLKYYFVDRFDPNAVRYWKHILGEDPARIGWWFGSLRRLDDALLRMPRVRRLAWNMIVWAYRPE